MLALNSVQTDVLLGLQLLPEPARHICTTGPEHSQLGDVIQKLARVIGDLSILCSFALILPIQHHDILVVFCGPVSCGPVFSGPVFSGPVTSVPVSSEKPLERFE